MSGFYKLNQQVLKMDVIKDKEKILFNHYLMQKENLQRLKGDLPKGQFYLTVRNVSEDLDITFAKAQRIIKRFEEMGIIGIIKLGGKNKTPSIYSYNSIFKTDTDSDTMSDTDSDTVKSSIFNSLNEIIDTVGDTVNDTHNDTSKKELLKRNTKKNLFVENSNEMNLSKLLFSLMQSNNSNVKQPNFQSWSKEFDYILRIDKRDIEEVRRVIEWCQSDSFWKTNILSPKSLRKHYDRLALKMQEDKKQQNKIIPLHNRNWEKEEQRKYKY